MLVSEIIPRILSHVQSSLSSTVDLPLSDVFESNPGSQFWLNLMQTVNDSYAVERISEEFLQQLATGYASDVEAYWIVWLLFHQNFDHQASVRLVLPIIVCFILFLSYCYVEWMIHDTAPLYRDQIWFVTFLNILIMLVFPLPGPCLLTNFYSGKYFLFVACDGSFNLQCLSAHLLQIHF